MAEIQWEKESVLPQGRTAAGSGRWKFLIAGVVILGAIAFLMVKSTLFGARYYVTIEELINDPDMHNKTVRVAGAVVGEPHFDAEKNELTFVVANIPNDNDTIREQGGLALVLHNAVNDPDAPRLTVIAHDQEIPDLLKHEAQAIMSGRLEIVDGEYIFYAEDIQLKCPTKYEDEVPQQAGG